MGSACRAPLSLLLLALLLAVCVPQQGSAQLANNFYAGKCGANNVERIITNSITASFRSNNGIAPGIVRLHFHDVFVGVSVCCPNARLSVEQVLASSYCFRCIWPRGWFVLDKES